MNVRPSKYKQLGKYSIPYKHRLRDAVNDITIHDVPTTVVSENSNCGQRFFKVISVFQIFFSNVYHKYAINTINRRVNIVLLFFAAVLYTENNRRLSIIILSIEITTAHAAAQTN